MSWIHVHRLALRALPADLRRKHGPAMEELFARELAEARGKGRGRAARTAAAAILDTLRRGIYERARRSSPPAHPLVGVRQDVAQSIRGLLAVPGFTGAVVLTLGLGIGASAAIFGVVDAVLLKPLPFPRSERVVHLAWEGGGHLQIGLSATKLEYWEDRVRSLEVIATWQPFVAEAEGEGVRAPLRGLRVGAGFLAATGYTPALGRGFLTSEHERAASEVALISHGTWRALFARVSDVVGRTLSFDGRTFTVVGVLPESFSFPYEPEPVDVLVPLAPPLVDPEDVAENWPTIARLADGFSPDEARAEVAALNAPFNLAHPAQVGERDRGMMLADFGELYVGSGERQALRLLSAGVGLMLLIACANVASLFLVRSAQRRRELAVRAALGATRGRISRLVLVEIAVIALAAGALGAALAHAMLDLLLGLVPTEIPGMDGARVDGRVLLFAFGTAGLTALVFGGPAAWPRRRRHLAGTIGEGARGTARSHRGRQGLLVGQAALSMILLMAAGVLVSTLVGLMRADPGWDPEDMFAVRVPVEPATYGSPPEVWDFQRRVTERILASPRTIAVAGASSLPLERGVNVPVSVTDRPDASGTVEWRAVTPGYFRTLDIPNVAGRTFDGADRQETPPVAVVNEAFARAFFADGSAIGRRVDLGSYRGELGDPSFALPGVEIVGVVADARDVSLRAEPRRTLYVPQAQAAPALSKLLGGMPVFLVRSRAGLAEVRGMVADALGSVDPGLPQPEVLPFERIMAASLARERFGAALVSTLAAVALALTAMGIYGLLAHVVRERRREIGIRMALGAAGGDVRRMVVARGARPVVVGLLLGAAASAALTRTIDPFLWGVSATDPKALLACAALLLGVAVLASWIPAREAVRVDPARTIGAE